jgi:hypothetical protein
MLKAMPPKPTVPIELKRGPFTVAQARRAGLARWHLEGASWRRVGRGLYVWAELSETPAQKLEAARLRLPAPAAFSGKTAAWLHGLEVVPCDPIEAILDGGEVVVRRGFRTTSMMRTLFDLSRRLSLVEAVVVADMAFHAGLVDKDEFSSWIGYRKGRQGVRAARRVLDLVESATESPMETRLRMLLVLNGLPRPEVQVTLRDERGVFLGRPDLFYRDHKLGLEYDGEFHRLSLVEDNRRQNRLLTAGIRLLRFTAADVLRRPGGVVAQVRDMLITR